MQNFGEVFDVVQHPQHPALLWGFAVDTQCAPFTHDGLDVRGWLLPREAPAQATIEVYDDTGKVLKRTRPEQARPDVAHYYPDADHAEQCGFCVRIEIRKDDPHRHGILHVRAVLHDDVRLELGAIHFRRYVPATQPGTLPPHLRQRQPGYELLRGHGIEIGAFNQPANLPAGCTVEYCDVASTEEVAKPFKEIDSTTLVEVDHVCDLDLEALPFAPESLDFVVVNHVLEHLANPILALERVFRVVKAGGHVALSIPDKEFTFDKPRALTPFAHLKEEYETGVTEVTDEHYLDFIGAAHPEILAWPAEERARVLTNVRNRREHVHVWDSASFAQFLEQAMELLRINAKSLFVSTGPANKFEYFAVWRKI